jgi:hypothetical protein
MCFLVCFLVSLPLGNEVLSFFDTYGSFNLGLNVLMLVVRLNLCFLEIRNKDLPVGRGFPLPRIYPSQLTHFTNVSPRVALPRRMSL